MTLAETRELWERFKVAEAQWDDPEPMVALFAEEGWPGGREALRRFELAHRRGLPDWRRDYLDVVIGEDAIAFRWRARGTHKGRYFGHEPTGREFDLTGASFLRVGGGQVVGAESVVGPPGIWEQLGLPEPGSAPEA